MLSFAKFGEWWLAIVAEFFGLIVWAFAASQAR